MNTVTKDFDRSFTEWTDDDLYKLWNLCEEKVPIVKLCQALRRFPDDVIFYLVEQENMSILDIPGIYNWNNFKNKLLNNRFFDYVENWSNDDCSDRRNKMLQRTKINVKIK